MAKSFEDQQKKYKTFDAGEEMCFVLRPHWRFIVVGVVIGAVIIYRVGCVVICVGKMVGCECCCSA